MLEQYDDLLTAALLGSGELKAFRNGRVWRIPKEAVIEFVCTRCRLK